MAFKVLRQEYYGANNEGGLHGVDKEMRQIPAFYADI